ncbi:MAG: carbohydrate ABC transporter permease, partial [Thermus sp.]|nr:carbohydrate ABC transporter permease [Thermus sp.]
MRVQNRLTGFLALLFLLLGSSLMVLPFLWMVLTSFKPFPELFELRFLPREPTWENYRVVLWETGFLRWFGNSLLVASLTTLSVLFFDSLAGYTLARLRFPGKNLIFVLILSTLMVPT